VGKLSDMLMVSVSFRLCARCDVRD